MHRRTRSLENASGTGAAKARAAIERRRKRHRRHRSNLDIIPELNELYNETKNDSSSDSEDIDTADLERAVGALQRGGNINVRSLFEVMLDSPENKKKHIKSPTPDVQANQEIDLHIEQRNPMTESNVKVKEEHALKEEQTPSAKAKGEPPESEKYWRDWTDKDSIMTAEDISMYMNISGHFQVMQTLDGDVVYHF